MPRSHFTLAHQIDALARLTSAPASLVKEIRAIFVRRGIALDKDALPYAEILDETFARAAEIERDSADARAAFKTLEENSRRFADACQELYGHLRSMEDLLRCTPSPTPAETAKRRRQARDRAAARRAAAAKPERPFFVILTPSDPE